MKLEMIDLKFELISVILEFKGCVLAEEYFHLSKLIFYHFPIVQLFQLHQLHKIFLIHVIFQVTITHHIL